MTYDPLLVAQANWLAQPTEGFVFPSRFLCYNGACFCR
jgi:hypothetical protein